MKIKYMLMSLAAMAAFSSCSKDDVSSESIFNTSEVQRNEFDKWLKTNYTDTYNIEFNYLYNDKLSDLTYNVVPADLDKSKAMAILMKHVWMDAYTEVAGDKFLKEHCFRQMQLIGSPEYGGQGTIILGTAEGGLKVLLFRVNELDPSDIFVNQDNPYRDHHAYPLDLNHWFFKNMHHEFCHILTQTKNYTTDFQTLSAGHYHAADWVNVEDNESPMEGFVTGYGSSEYNEDFAETYAMYVTNSDEGWQKILDNGVDTLSCDIEYEDYVDANGNKEYELDAKGFLIPETDANGNIVYQKDAKGNYVYFTLGGNKVPVYATQSKSLIYLLNEGSGYIAWTYGGKNYNLTTRLKTDTPVFETTEVGDTVYDKSGNPVPLYYKMPVFKTKKVAVYKNVNVDSTGRDLILQKLDIVKAYFKDTWGVDIEELRKVVLRRSKEASSLDLNSLK